MSDTPDEAPPEGTREYTREEYMRAFGISDSTLDRHIAHGKIIKRKVGRRVFLRLPADATPEESREDPYRALLEVNRRLVEQVAAMHEAIIRMEAKINAGPQALPQGDATAEAPRKAPLWRRLLGIPE